LSQHHNSQVQSSQINFSLNTPSKEIPEKKVEVHPPSSSISAGNFDTSLGSISGDCVPVNVRNSRSSGGIGVLPRATTLLPTQEECGQELLRDERLRNDGVDNKVQDNANITNNVPEACISRPKKNISPEPIEQSGEVNSTRSNISSPVQMCDIKIEVDFSEPKVKQESTVESPFHGSSPSHSCRSKASLDFKKVESSTVVKSETNVDITTSAVTLVEPEVDELQDIVDKKRASKKRKSNQKMDLDDSMQIMSSPRSRRKLEDNVITEVLEENYEMTGSAYENMNDEDDGEDGWCSAKRNIKKRKIENVRQAPLNSSPPLLSTVQPDVKEEEDILEYPQAVSVEVTIAMRESPTPTRLSSNGRIFDRNLTIRGDKRRFVKNFVKGHFCGSSPSGGNERGSSDQRQVVISLREMDKLLPKESEREIQVRVVYMWRFFPK
jgi:hypothetical protein